jgi:hypothetical protein
VAHHQRCDVAEPLLGFVEDPPRGAGVGKVCIDGRNPLSALLGPDISGFWVRAGGQLRVV